MLLQVFLSIDAVKIIGYKSCGDLSLLLKNTTDTFGGYIVVISKKVYETKRYVYNISFASFVNLN